MPRGKLWELLSPYSHSPSKSKTMTPWPVCATTQTSDSKQMPPPQSSSWFQYPQFGNLRPPPRNHTKLPQNYKDCTYLSRDLRIILPLFCLVLAKSNNTPIFLPVGPWGQQLPLPQVVGEEKLPLKLFHALLGPVNETDKRQINEHSQENVTQGGG